MQTSFIPEISDEQILYIHKFGKERKTLLKPTVLIVEDQQFSCTLLHGMVNRHYGCHIARTGKEAIQLYLEHVPSIAFLDIELPDINGHELAQVMRQWDPFAYLVMVTANNYPEDVIRAKKNNVQGFIVKPFSKSKIIDSIERYTYADRHSTHTKTDPSFDKAQSL